MTVVTVSAIVGVWVTNTIGVFFAFVALAMPTTAIHTPNTCDESVFPFSVSHVSHVYMRLLAPQTDETQLTDQLLVHEHIERCDVHTHPGQTAVKGLGW